MKQNELHRDASSLKRNLRALGQKLLKWGQGAQAGFIYIKLKTYQSKSNTDANTYVKNFRERQRMKLRMVVVFPEVKEEEVKCGNHSIWKTVDYTDMFICCCV